ncbi:hypothetical protein RHMOL_Rhmol05G0032700 [Rhododendron molle]|uniref:Uncharacterized protein n=1 Tax=Rhododendron molle TaxID=49168 RepID=A0ACC0NM22_RHOML|nr:hypothetical protein RHMOL_Rhmol05G0032700 [Rhododendron molle]
MADLPAQPILEAPSRPNSPSLTHILDLPEELLDDIVCRLGSVDLARSRCVSNTFFDISTEFRSINLLCHLGGYINSGRPITPFKISAMDLILGMKFVDSISIGVEERANHESLDVNSDDLYLTEVSFVDGWLRSLRRVPGRFTSLSISDYPMHSRGKWSEVLSLISLHCKNLHELVLKNAWLSTNGLSAMLMLTSLKLEFVRLDDEDLDKVNRCCPFLRNLNLIMVEGLKKPQIDLLHLRTYKYVGSSLATTERLPLIHAPNLTRLEFGPCVDKIKRLDFDLSKTLTPRLSIDDIYLVWFLENVLKDMDNKKREIEREILEVGGI